MIGTPEYFSLGERSKIKQLHLKVDFRSREPVTEQIRDQVRFLIASGELKPGDQLPTVRQLAADLRVNFNTVARAYRTLDDESLISTQHGRGTFVLEPPPSLAPEDLRRQMLNDLTKRCLERANKLGFTPEEIDDSFRKAMNAKKQKPAGNAGRDS